MSEKKFYVHRAGGQIDGFFLDGRTNRSERKVRELFSKLLRPGEGLFNLRQVGAVWLSEAGAR